MALNARVRQTGQLTARVKPLFPARFVSSTAISVVRSGGVVTIAWDSASLSEKTSVSAAERDNIFLAVYDSDNTNYRKITIDTLLTTISAGLDATLVAIAGLTPTTDQGIYFTGTDAAAVYSLTASGRALAGLTGAADKVPYFSSSTVATTADLTSFGRSLIDDANAAAALTTLGIAANVQTWLATPSSANLAAAVTDETGSGALVFATSPTLVTPTLGAAVGTSLQLSGLTASSAVATDASKNLVSVTNTGSGNNVLATSPTLVTPALGTPSSVTLTNATGLPVSTGISGLGTGVATFLATPSSANLRAALTDEVGTGVAYFVGGALGTPASATLTNATGLPLSGLATQAAYSIVGNFTGSAAVPTASTIGGLTQKASPASSDLLLLQDQAASGQLKYATVSSVASAGSVSSLNGLTGAIAWSVVKQIFTASGTYTPTSGMVYCIIECVGGGGGGAGCSNSAGQTSGSGGGGAGGYSRKYASASDIGASKAVTIGSAGGGGAGGFNNGSAGSATSVGALCVANGGSGGAAASGGGGSGGAGGTAGTGDITAPGAPGGAGLGGTIITITALSGGGGSGPFGAGGAAIATNSAINGNAATGYGAGGGGGASYNGTAGGNAAGGSGVAGLVVITEFVIA